MAFGRRYNEVGRCGRFSREKVSVHGENGIEIRECNSSSQVLQ